MRRARGAPAGREAEFTQFVGTASASLLISGSKRRNEATQFRIVTGHGSFVVPVKQKARKLSLALREAEIVEECITSQGIRLNVRAVAAPHAAAVASQARIAKARADQEATERELAAASMMAKFERDTAIKRAGFLAETDQAQAVAAQAGPLAEALIAVNRLMEILPALVEAAARGLADANLTVLSGTQGVNEVAAVRARPRQTDQGAT